MKPPSWRQLVCTILIYLLVAPLSVSAVTFSWLQRHWFGTVLSAVRDVTTQWTTNDGSSSQSWEVQCFKVLVVFRLPIAIRSAHQFMKLLNVKISSRIISNGANKFLIPECFDQHNEVILFILTLFCCIIKNWGRGSLSIWLCNPCLSYLSVSAFLIVV